MWSTRISLFCVFFLVAPLKAQALDASAHGECVGGTHEVTVSGHYVEELGGEIYDGEISGLVFECQAIGVCEPSFFFPETPLPFEPYPDPNGGFPRYSAEFSIVPPISGVTYRYKPYGVRPDGTLVPTSHHCGSDHRSYALVGCGDIPIARGVIFDYASYGLPPGLDFRICDTNCWSENIWLEWEESMIEELSGLPLEVVLDEVIDIYGTRTYCGMLGAPYYDISRIEITTGGDCGSVPVKRENWDSLKAMYR